ncbi:hypothetical protein P3S67_017898 [Capsicum chacoense]
MQFASPAARKHKNMELLKNVEVDPEEKLLQSDWEITAASEKLAECQQTILNLGKQLKALASPADPAIYNFRYNYCSHDNPKEKFWTSFISS